MVTFSISFDDEVVERWSALAAAQGVDLDEKIIEAIIDRMEEMEDYEALKDRLFKPGEAVSNEEFWKRLRSEPRDTIPHEEIRREFGLDDVADAD
jgi:predicted DNA-binding protein